MVSGELWVVGGELSLTAYGQVAEKGAYTLFTRSGIKMVPKPRQVTMTSTDCWVMSSDVE